jgi:hypothetical protein
MLMLVPIATNFSLAHGALLADAPASSVRTAGAVLCGESEHAAATPAAHNATIGILLYIGPSTDRVARSAPARMSWSAERRLLTSRPILVRSQGDPAVRPAASIDWMCGLPARSPIGAATFPVGSGAVSVGVSR